MGMDMSGDTSKQGEKCPTCGNEYGDERGKFCSNSFHLAAPQVYKHILKLTEENARLRKLVEIGFNTGYFATGPYLKVWKQFKRDNGI
jgi:hypothetical protein